MDSESCSSSLCSSQPCSPFPASSSSSCKSSSSSHSSLSPPSSESRKTRNIKQKQSIIADKKCLICGDKASAFNFGGLSCETCKIFFRRNAFHFETLRCNKSGNCQIELSNRKACSKCRLAKCYAIGMKKELLYSRKSQKYSVEEEIEKKDAIIREERIFYSKKLIAPEQELLEELSSAMSIFADENRQEAIGQVLSAAEVFNLQGLYIRKIIKFCKALPCFRKLKQLDQMTILKPFHTEITCIRHAYLYRPDMDGFYTIANEDGDKVYFVPSEAFHDPVLDMVVYCRNFLRFFHAALESDQYLLALIVGHMLFKPRENVTCLEYLSNQYLIYCRLIRRYLEHKHSDTHSTHDIEQKYAAIMLLLKELAFIRCTQIQILKASERGKLYRVMIELYNITDIDLSMCPLMQKPSERAFGIGS